MDNFYKAVKDKFDKDKISINGTKFSCEICWETDTNWHLFFYKDKQVVNFGLAFGFIGANFKKPYFAYSLGNEPDEIDAKKYTEIIKGCKEIFANIKRPKGSGIQRDGDTCFWKYVELSYENGEKIDMEEDYAFANCVIYQGKIENAVANFIALLRAVLQKRKRRVARLWLGSHFG